MVICHGQVEMAALLLGQGADINACDRVRRTDKSIVHCAHINAYDEVRGTDDIRSDLVRLDAQVHGYLPRTHRAGGRVQTSTPSRHQRHQRYVVGITSDQAS